MAKRLNGWVRIWIVLSVPWLIFFLAMSNRYRSLQHEAQERRVIAQRGYDRATREVRELNPDWVAIPTSKLGVEERPFTVFLPENWIIGDQPAIQKWWFKDKYIQSEFRSAAPRLPPSKQRDLLNRMDLVWESALPLVDEPPSVTQYKAKVISAYGFFDSITRDTREISMNGEFSNVAAVVGVGFPLVLLGLGYLIHWIRIGFGTGQTTQSTPALVKASANMLPSLVLATDAAATGGPQPAETAPTPVETSLPPIPASPSNWPKFDWSDWVALLAAGLVSEYGVKFTLAMLLRINSSIYTIPETFAFYLVPFGLYYTIKFVNAKTRQAKGLPYSKARSAKWLLGYFLFCIAWNAFSILYPPGR